MLLIDGDLRRPRLHDIFQVSNAIGFSDLLQSLSDSETVPEGAIHALQSSGLHVMTAGTKTANISRLLYSAFLPILLRRLRSEFDLILIDSPPMLQLADARVLVRAVETYWYFGPARPPGKPRTQRGSPLPRTALRCSAQF